MKNKFLRTIEQYNMISEGDTVAVCLSGGADSMALFHLMCVYKESLGIDLFAIHINHGLRSESDEEEITVIKYCEKLGAECVTEHFNMNGKEKPQGLSTEMWARQLRYDAFGRIAKERNAKLATAHTLSDKCETVLFNISRGASLKGAQGIPAVRGNIIRPLIDCTREDIENYCKENGIPFVTDNTNFCEDYSRNKIRLRVIPALKEINPQSEGQIGEFTREMEQIYTFLTQLSDTLYRNSVTLNGFDLNTVKKADDVVIKFFLRNVLDKYHCLSKDNIEAILCGIKSESFSRQLSAEVICDISDGYLSFYKPKTEKEQTEVSPVQVNIGQRVDFLSKSFKIFKISQEESEKNKKIDKNYLKNCIDCDKINNGLFFRTRKVGDTFTLRERKVTKTLKKLFIEDKIPVKLRNSLTVLADGSDNVIWLEGYGTNGKFSVDKNTNNIIVIEEG